jgi:hypothetical protein
LDASVALAQSPLGLSAAGPQPQQNSFDPSQPIFSIDAASGEIMLRQSLMTLWPVAGASDISVAVQVCDADVPGLCGAAVSLWVSIRPPVLVLDAQSGASAVQLQQPPVFMNVRTTASASSPWLLLVPASNADAPVGAPVAALRVWPGRRVRFRLLPTVRGALALLNVTASVRQVSVAGSSMQCSQETLSWRAASTWWQVGDGLERASLDTVPALACTGVVDSIAALSMDSPAVVVTWWNREAPETILPALDVTPPPLLLGATPPSGLQGSLVTLTGVGLASSSSQVADVGIISLTPAFAPNSSDASDADTAAALVQVGLDWYTVDEASAAPCTTWQALLSGDAFQCKVPAAPATVRLGLASAGIYVRLSDAATSAELLIWRGGLFSYPQELALALEWATPDNAAIAVPSSLADSAPLTPAVVLQVRDNRGAVLDDPAVDISCTVLLLGNGSSGAGGDAAGGTRMIRPALTGQVNAIPVTLASLRAAKLAPGMALPNALSAAGPANGSDPTRLYAMFSVGVYGSSATTHHLTASCQLQYLGFVAVFQSAGPLRVQLAPLSVSWAAAPPAAAFPSVAGLTADAPRTLDALSPAPVLQWQAAAGVGGVTVPPSAVPSALVTGTVCSLRSAAPVAGGSATVSLVGQTACESQATAVWLAANCSLLDANITALSAAAVAALQSGTNLSAAVSALHSACVAAAVANCSETVQSAACSGFNLTEQATVPSTAGGTVVGAAQACALPGVGLVGAMGARVSLYAVCTWATGEQVLSPRSVVKLAALKLTPVSRLQGTFRYDVATNAPAYSLVPADAAEAAVFSRVALVDGDVVCSIDPSARKRPSDPLSTFDTRVPYVGGQVSLSRPLNTSSSFAVSLAALRLRPDLTEFLGSSGVLRHPLLVRVQISCTLRQQPLPSYEDVLAYRNVTIVWGMVGGPLPGMAAVNASVPPQGLVASVAASPVTPAAIAVSLLDSDTGRRFLDDNETECVLSVAAATAKDGSALAEGVAYTFGTTRAVVDRGVAVFRGWALHAPLGSAVQLIMACTRPEPGSPTLTLAAWSSVRDVTVLLVAARGVVVNGSSADAVFSDGLAALPQVLARSLALGPSNTPTHVSPNASVGVQDLRATLLPSPAFSTPATPSAAGTGISVLHGGVGSGVQLTALLFWSWLPLDASSGTALGGAASYAWYDAAASPRSLCSLLFVGESSSAPVTGYTPDADTSFGGASAAYNSVPVGNASEVTFRILLRAPAEVSRRMQVACTVGDAGSTVASQPLLASVAGLRAAFLTDTPRLGVPSTRSALYPITDGELRIGVTTGGGFPFLAETSATCEFTTSLDAVRYSIVGGIPVPDEGSPTTSAQATSSDPLSAPVLNGTARLLSVALIAPLQSMVAVEVVCRRAGGGPEARLNFTVILASVAVRWVAPPEPWLLFGTSYAVAVQVELDGGDGDPSLRKPLRAAAYPGLQATCMLKQSIAPLSAAASLTSASSSSVLFITAAAQVGGNEGLANLTFTLNADPGVRFDIVADCSVFGSSTATPAALSVMDTVTPYLAPPLPPSVWIPSAVSQRIPLSPPPLVRLRRLSDGSDLLSQEATCRAGLAASYSADILHAAASYGVALSADTNAALAYELVSNRDFVFDPAKGGIALSPLPIVGGWGETVTLIFRCTRVGINVLPELNHSLTLKVLRVAWSALPPAEVISKSAAPLAARIEELPLLAVPAPGASNGSAAGMAGTRFSLGAPVSFNDSRASVTCSVDGPPAASGATRLVLEHNSAAVRTSGALLATDSSVATAGGGSSSTSTSASTSSGSSSGSATSSSSASSSPSSAAATSGVAFTGLGVAPFAELTLTGQAGTAYELSVSCRLGELALPPVLAVNVTVSGCPAGQEPVGDGSTCAGCAEGFYSFGETMRCVRCPPIGVSCAAGVLALLPGFFLAIPSGFSGPVVRSSDALTGGNQYGSANATATAMARRLGTGLSRNLVAADTSETAASANVSASSFFFYFAPSGNRYSLPTADALLNASRARYSGRELQATYIDAGTELHECPEPDACLVDAELRAFGCAEGHTGPLCGVCNEAEGWVRSGSKCAQCLPWGANIALLFLGGMAVLAVLTYIALFISFTTTSDGRVVWRLTLNFVSSVGALALYQAKGTASWVSIVGVVQTVVLPGSSATLQLSPFQCVFKVDWWTRYYMLVSMPVLIAFACLAINVLAIAGRGVFLCCRVIRLRRAARASTVGGLLGQLEQSSRAQAIAAARKYSAAGELLRLWQSGRFVSILLFCFFLLYPSITNEAVSVFRCMSAPIAGTRYLEADLSVSCDDNKHQLGRILAGIIIALFVAGLPALFAVFLWWNRRLVQQGGKAEGFWSKFSFLLQGLKVHRITAYAYESFVMIRKALLVLVPSVVRDSYVQSILASMVLMVSVLVHLSVNPYVRKLFSRLESASLMTLSLTMSIAVIYQRSSDAQYLSVRLTAEATTVLLVLLNGCMLVTLAYFFFTIRAREVIAAAGVKNTRELIRKTVAVAKQRASMIVQGGARGGSARSGRSGTVGSSNSLGISSGRGIGPGVGGSNSRFEPRPLPAAVLRQGDLGRSRRLLQDALPASASQRNLLLGAGAGVGDGTRTPPHLRRVGASSRGMAAGSARDLSVGGHAASRAPSARRVGMGLGGASERRLGHGSTRLLPAAGPEQPGKGVRGLGMAGAPPAESGVPSPARSVRRLLATSPQQGQAAPAAGSLLRSQLSSGALPVGGSGRAAGGAASGSTRRLQLANQSAAATASAPATAGSAGALPTTHNPLLASALHRARGPQPLGSFRSKRSAATVQASATDGAEGWSDDEGGGSDASQRDRPPKRDEWAGVGLRTILSAAFTGSVPSGLRASVERADDSAAAGRDVAALGRGHTSSNPRRQLGNPLAAPSGTASSQRNLPDAAPGSSRNVASAGKSAPRAGAPSGKPVGRSLAAFDFAQGAGGGRCHLQRPGSPRKHGVGRSDGSRSAVAPAPASPHEAAAATRKGRGERSKERAAAGSHEVWGSSSEASDGGSAERIDEWDEGSDGEPAVRTHGDGGLPVANGHASVLKASHSESESDEAWSRRSASSRGSSPSVSSSGGDSGHELTHRKRLSVAGRVSALGQQTRDAVARPRSTRNPIALLAGPPTAAAVAGLGAASGADAARASAPPSPPLAGGVLPMSGPGGAAPHGTQPAPPPAPQPAPQRASQRLTIMRSLRGMWSAGSGALAATPNAAAAVGVQASAGALDGSALALPPAASGSSARSSTSSADAAAGPRPQATAAPARSPVVSLLAAARNPIPSLGSQRRLAAASGVRRTSGMAGAQTNGSSVRLSGVHAPSGRLSGMQEGTLVSRLSAASFAPFAGTRPISQRIQGPPSAAVLQTAGRHTGTPALGSSQPHRDDVAAPEAGWGAAAPAAHAPTRTSGSVGAGSRLGAAAVFERSDCERADARGDADGHNTARSTGGSSRRVLSAGASRRSVLHDDADEDPAAPAGASPGSSSRGLVLRAEDARRAAQPDAGDRTSLRLRGFFRDAAASYEASGSGSSGPAREARLSANSASMFNAVVAAAAAAASAAAISALSSPPPTAVATAAVTASLQAPAHPASGAHPHDSETRPANSVLADAASPAAAADEDTGSDHW